MFKELFSYKICIENGKNNKFNLILSINAIYEKIFCLNVETPLLNLNVFPIQNRKNVQNQFYENSYKGVDYQALNCKTNEHSQIQGGKIKSVEF